jgi:hypothetical protein
MSTAVATSNFQFTKFRRYAPMSRESLQVDTSWKANETFLQSSASYWLPLATAALEQIRAECRRDDWDGPNSAPVTDMTIAATADFARAMYHLLPVNVPPPDIIPEGDGDISVDWIISPSEIFSVSVSERSTVSFAGQFGREGGEHGWRRLDRSSPSALEGSLRDIAELVKRLYSSPAASCR